MENKMPRVRLGTFVLMAALLGPCFAAPSKLERDIHPDRFHLNRLNHPDPSFLNRGMHPDSRRALGGPPFMMSPPSMPSMPGSVNPVMTPVFGNAMINPGVMYPQLYTYDAYSNPFGQYGQVPSFLPQQSKAPPAETAVLKEINHMETILENQKKELEEAKQKIDEEAKELKTLNDKVANTEKLLKEEDGNKKKEALKETKPMETILESQKNELKEDKQKIDEEAKELKTLNDKVANMEKLLKEEDGNKKKEEAVSDMKQEMKLQKVETKLRMKIDRVEEMLKALELVSQKMTNSKQRSTDSDVPTPHRSEQDDDQGATS